MLLAVLVGGFLLLLPVLEPKGRQTVLLAVLVGVLKPLLPVLVFPYSNPREGFPFEVPEAVPFFKVIKTDLLRTPTKQRHRTQDCYPSLHVAKSTASREWVSRAPPYRSKCNRVPRRNSLFRQPVNHLGMTTLFFGGRHLNTGQPAGNQLVQIHPGDFSSLA